MTNQRCAASFSVVNTAVSGLAANSGLAAAVYSFINQTGKQRHLINMLQQITESFGARSRTYGLAMISSHLPGSPVDILNVLSERNKKRCQAQLDAMGKSVASHTSGKNFKKQAAVLIPLGFVDCQPSIVFTLRSSKLRSHAGQVSFPGGMVDDTDENKIEAALRESEEELGLNTSNIEIWGSMLPLPDRQGDVQITPIIANLGQIDVTEFNPNYEEVECVFTRDISSLCAAKNFSQTTFTTPSGGYTLPVFLGGEHKIWGLTALILHQTLTLLAPEQRAIENNLSIFKESVSALEIIKQTNTENDRNDEPKS